MQTSFLSVKVISPFVKKGYGGNKKCVKCSEYPGHGKGFSMRDMSENSRRREGENWHSHRSDSSGHP